MTEPTPVPVGRLQPWGLAYYGEVDAEVPGGGIHEVHSTSEHSFILDADIVYLQARRVYTWSLEVSSGSEVIADEGVIGWVQAPSSSVQTGDKTAIGTFICLASHSRYLTYTQVQISAVRRTHPCN
jgi:hypothetical protein